MATVDNKSQTYANYLQDPSLYKLQFLSVYSLCWHSGVR